VWPPRAPTWVLITRGDQGRGATVLWSEPRGVPASAFGMHVTHRIRPVRAWRCLESVGTGSAPRSFAAIPMGQMHRRRRAGRSLPVDIPFRNADGDQRVWSVSDIDWIRPRSRSLRPPIRERNIGSPRRSAVDVAPEIPAGFDGSWIGRDRTTIVDLVDPSAGRDRDSAPASATARDPRLRRGGHLHELQSSNRCSIVDDIDGGDQASRRGRSVDLDGDLGGLPARADLAALEGSALAVQTAVSELARDRSTEVPAGPASGAGAVADPAPRGLGLGCPTMRAAPHRHGPMVAASGPVVDAVRRRRDPLARTNAAPAPASYLTIVMTV
jgi:hypothetical protein